MDTETVDGPRVVVEHAGAAFAVAHAMPPLQFDRVAAAGPPTGRHAYVAARIEHAMRAVPAVATDAWWAASGAGVTAALEHTTGVPGTAASFYVSAALHAYALAGADRVEDKVLRLAERAACWHDGYLHALHRPSLESVVEELTGPRH